MNARVLRVLISRDRMVPTLWVAHCLDGDFVAQGASFAEALSELPTILKIAHARARSMAVFDMDGPAAQISMFDRVEQVGHRVTLGEAIQKAGNEPGIFSVRFPFAVTSVATSDSAAPSPNEARTASPLELAGCP